MEVDTVTLDSILLENDYDLMKLDVEGHETTLFEGSEHWSRINAIVMEYHRLADGSTTLDVVQPLIICRGYACLVDSRFSILYAVKRQLLDELGLAHLGSQRHG